MANRFPLVLDTSSGNKIAEIAAGDNLDLRQTSIVDVQDITALGNINAASVSVNGQDIKPGVFTDLTDAPNSYTGNENFIIRVNSAGTGLEFFQLGGDAQPLSVTDLAISGDIQPTVAPGGDIGSTTQGFNAIFANYFQGSIKGNNGSTVFDAATNQIPYSVIVGGPTAMSDLTNDLGFVTNAQLNDGTVTVEIKNTGDLQGSVFGEDSTLLVDHINGRINAARLTRNGANDGQTIVWNTATELWEPGTAGDITGFASNKTDTLTVQDGYKITFAAAIGNIEGNQINITPAVGYTVDLGNTRMQANAGIQPTNNAEGAIGTASKKFNEGHFVTLTADTLLGAFQGDLVNNETRSNAIVAGDKTAANAGYGFHLVNTTGGVTNASLNFNGNDLIAANLVNATGEISGNVYGDDSTILVDGLNNKIRGDIEFAVTEGYIAGKNINITPEGGYFVKLGNTEVTGTVTPAVDGAGNLGTVAKKFGQGYFSTVNATTIDADNVIADVLTATSFNITGSGVGTFSSGGDLVIDTGNRIILQGGPAKLPILTTAERDAFPTIDADTIYNSTDDRFQFRQNGQWITLHEGTFNGDVIGNVTGDLTGNITGADRNGAVAPADVTITAGDETTASQNGADVTISGGAPGAGGTHGGVNIGNAAGANQIDGDTTFGHDVIVTGNFTVNGTTTSVDSVNLEVEDNTILLNKNETGAGVTAGSAGIEIERGTETNSSILWSEGDDRWYINGGVLNAALGIITDAITAVSVTSDLKGSVFADDSGLMVDAVANHLTSATGEITSFVSPTITGTLIQPVATGQITIGNNSVGTISYNDSTGAINATSTGGVTIAGAATGTVTIGNGTSGNVTLGNGSNTIDIAENSTLDLTNVTVTGLSTSITGNVTGNIDNTNLTVGATATTTTISNASGRIDAASTIRMLGTPLASIENEEQTSTIRLFDTTYTGATNGAQMILQTPLVTVSNNLQVDGTTQFTNQVTSPNGFKGSVYSDAGALVIDGATGTLAGDGVTGAGTTTFTITTPDTSNATVPEAIQLEPGDASATGQAGGNIALLAGASNDNTGGTVILRAGASTSGTGGTTYIDGGDGATDGNVAIGTGHLTSATAEIIIGASGATDTTVDGNRLRIRTTNIPTTSKGASGDRIGEVAFDGAAIYFCVADYTNGSPDIWRKQAWGNGAAW